MNSRLLKIVIVLLGIATLASSILALIFMGQKNSNSFFFFKMISQCVLVVEFALIAFVMYQQKRTRKNAIAIFICAIVFAVSAVQTFLSHT